MRRRTIFITASDTDAGKTYLTCGLIRGLRAAGLDALALKPVVAGRNAHGDYDDLQALLRAQGLKDTAAINRYRFAAARAPAYAARHTPLIPQTLIAWCRQRMRAADIVLIEGVGGVMVPLARDFLVSDWIQALAPDEVWLVARARLGAINHMLLSMDRLARIKHPPCRIILNAPDRHGQAYLDDMRLALRTVAGQAKIHTLLAGEMPAPHAFGLCAGGEPA